MLFEDVGIRARVPHVWEVSTPHGDGEDYLPVDVIADGSAGLTRAGVVRLLLPGGDDMGAPSNDVLRQLRAGVGDRPPRIDDADVAARLVTWIRLRPDAAAHLTSLRLAWAGINAVAIEQRRTLGRQTIGHGTGASDLELSLGAASVESDSLAIEVEEDEGMRTWRAVADVAAAGRGERVFSLDSEAGTVRFGDGVRGRAPEAGRVIQVARMRAGGGAAGNLPAGVIQTISAPAGAPRLKVLQPLPTTGGADAENLADAEARIPAQIRHGGRAVTAADYRELALRTPGVSIGRVEVLERFKPQQRRDGVPGVVSVMALPARQDTDAPAPRPDRPLLETVFAWLDERRPLTTELYVIGADYVPLGVSAAVELVDSNQREAVLNMVTAAIRLHLWALPPGGSDGNGWPLGRAVDDRTIEAVVARVPGVATVGADPAVRPRRRRSALAAGARGCVRARTAAAAALADARTLDAVTDGGKHSGNEPDRRPGDRRGHRRGPGRSGGLLMDANGLRFFQVASPALWRLDGRATAPALAARNLHWRADTGLVRLASQQTAPDLAENEVRARTLAGTTIGRVRSIWRLRLVGLWHGDA